MIVKLLTEHQFEFLKEAAEARPSLHLSKCHIVVLMHWLNLQLRNGYSFWRRRFYISKFFEVMHAMCSAQSK